MKILQTTNCITISKRLILIALINKYHKYSQISFLNNAPPLDVSVVFRPDTTFQFLLSSDDSLLCYFGQK